MSKQAKRSLSIVAGAALVTGLGTAGIANADTNEDVFSMEELSSGYLTAGGHKTEGSCGEGKCGDDKGGEGSCGGDKGGEGKCGEGKCGSS